MVKQKWNKKIYHVSSKKTNKRKNIMVLIHTIFLYNLIQILEIRFLVQFSITRYCQETFL
jgi:hypothetical protein